jgi:hypothetical protein
VYPPAGAAGSEYEAVPDSGAVPVVAQASPLATGSSAAPVRGSPPLESIVCGAVEAKRTSERASAANVGAVNGPPGAASRGQVWVEAFTPSGAAGPPRR